MKRTKPRLSLTRLFWAPRPLILLLVYGVAAPHPVFAAPQGEQVVHGTATFSRDGNLTTIHASDRAIINYQSFGIGSNETVQFVQPSEAARVLNRVTGFDATQIDGSLRANGIVYILNPQGIFFGNQAIIDVGGLVAAAGHMSNDDFLKGIDHFTRLEGTVANAGEIHARAVSLLGRDVTNMGAIRVDDGVIALVAGDEVWLGPLFGHVMVKMNVSEMQEAPGIQNTGTLDAGKGRVSLAAGDMYAVAAQLGGTIRGKDLQVAGGENGIVDVTGTLDASDREAGQTGGKIEVTGDEIALRGATLDASGDAGGGTIHVGGDFQGKGTTPTARRTYVSKGSTLSADAVTRGDGGDVVVWADEATHFRGDLVARGGVSGGDGGNAEVSGHQLRMAGTVDLSAPAGRTGNLLLDPVTVTITGGSGDGAADGTNTFQGAATPGQVDFADAGPTTIFESEIEGLNANITIQATRSISTTGTFSDNDADTHADVLVQNNRNLTLQTRNAAGDGAGSINLTGSTNGTDLEFRTQGTGTIDIHAATDAAPTTGAVTLGRLESGSGNITVSTGNGSIALDNDVTSASGNVSLTATGGSIARTAGTVQGGTVTLNGTTGVGLLGAPILTTAATLLGNGGTGGFFVGETNGVTLGDGVSGIATTNGAVNVAAGGAVDVQTGGVSAGTGNVTISTTGALNGVGAGPHIASSGDVALTGTAVGGGTQIDVNAGGVVDASRLSIAANGAVDVDVSNAGFGRIALTQANPAANASITQAGGDTISITGAGTTQTINQVNTAGSGAAVTYSSTAPTGDVVIHTGTVTLAADTVIQSADDITIGDASGVAFDANEFNLGLVAGTDGSGAILDGDGRIDDANNLVLRAATGIGASGSGNRILVRGGGNGLSLAAQNTVSGGVFVEDNNAAAEAVSIANLTVTDAADATKTATANGITTAGAVEIVSPGALALATSVQSTGNNAVTLTASGGALTRTAGTVQGGAVSLNGSAGVGTTGAIQTDANSLSGSGGTGVFNVSDAGSTALGTINAGTTATIAAAAALTNGGTVTAPAVVLNGVTGVGTTSAIATDTDTLSGSGGTGVFNVSDAGSTAVGAIGGSPTDISLQAANELDLLAASYSASGAISLSTKSGNTPPFATIVGPGDVTFNAGTTFSMGANDKLSTPGMATINAGTAKLSDVSALGIRVQAGRIEFQTRAPAQVLATLDAAGNPITATSIQDNGMDLVANQIFLSVEPTLLPGFSVVLATPTGSDLTGVVPANFFVARRAISTNLGGRQLQASDFNTFSTANTTPDFLGQGPLVSGCLDCQTASFVNQDETSLWNLAEAPEPPPTPDEVLKFLNECDPETDPTCKGKAPEEAATTLGNEAALDAQELYRDLVKSKSTTDRIGPVLQAGVEHCRQRGAGGGTALRSCLASNPEYADAVGYLDRLELLFAQFTKLGLAPGGLQSMREDILTEIINVLDLQGITVQDLGEAIGPNAALPAGGTGV